MKIELEHFDCPKSVAIVVIIMGCIACLAGCTYIYMFIHRKLTCNYPIQAKMTHQREWDRSGHNIGSVYTPILEYEVNGVKYKKAYFIRDKSPQFNDGEYVAIYINPQKPDIIYMPQKKEWILLLVMTIMAVFGGWVVCIISKYAFNI